MQLKRLETFGRVLQGAELNLKDIEIIGLLIYLVLCVLYG